MFDRLFANPLARLLAGRRTEHYWCRRLAPLYRARREMVLPDGSRCDLISEIEAIEVDWARKWPEAVGQSLLYSIQTGLRPAIILLIADPAREARYLRRCRQVCRRCGIHLYEETLPDLVGPQSA